MFIYRWWWFWKNYETANKLGIKVRRIEPNQAKVAYRNKWLLAQKTKLYNLFWKTTLRCNTKCKYCGSRAGDTQLISYESASLEMDFKRRSRKYEWWRPERRKTNKKNIRATKKRWNISIGYNRGYFEKLTSREGEHSSWLWIFNNNFQLSTFI